MSASRKKQLRKEQAAATLTEKQKKQNKESRRLKLATVAFFVALALMVGLVVCIAVNNSGLIDRATTALLVGEHKLNSVEFNYFYMDAVNSFYNTYGSYASLFGLDTSKPLSAQEYGGDEGWTWADYFVDQAKLNAASTYALYDAAVAAGHTLTDDEKASIDSNIESITSYATQYGYTDVGSYLAAVYGKGASVKSYKNYSEIQALGSSYYSAYQEALNFDDAALRAHEADKYAEYSSFNYASCYLAAASFYEGGETDSEGNTTYSDEEKAAGLKAAKAAADELAKATTVEELDEAYAALSINAADEDAASSKSVDTRYSNVTSALRDWVADTARKAGDITVIENTSTTTGEDGNEVTNVTGYYVVRFESVNDNTFPLVNVRHILVAFQGGTTDDNGTVTYSEEEMATAKTQAEALLAQWESGEATEASFAALATEKTDDTASAEDGGLYNDVYPGQMVTNFNDWCFAEGRKPGDTGIVESSYGYHVMYYSSDSTTNYRDYLITTELTSEAMSSWYEGLTEAITTTEKNVSRVNRDLMISSAS